MKDCFYERIFIKLFLIHLHLIQLPKVFFIQSRTARPGSELHPTPAFPATPALILTPAFIATPAMIAMPGYLSTPAYSATPTFTT
jgi:hypothetical protein